MSKEEKMSLLKPYTNNDRINDMSVEEKAVFFANSSDCERCAFRYEFCENKQCKEGIKQWLESEAEE